MSSGSSRRRGKTSSTQRNEDFREARNTATENMRFDVEDLRYKTETITLYPLIVRSVAVPITLRVSLMAAFTVFDFLERVLPVDLPGMISRRSFVKVFMGMLHVKMCSAHRKIVQIPANWKFRVVDVPTQVQRTVMRFCELVPKPLQRYIECLGIFSHHGNDYIPFYDIIGNAGNIADYYASCPLKDNYTTDAYFKYHVMYQDLVLPMEAESSSESSVDLRPSSPTPGPSSGKRSKQGASKKKQQRSSPERNVRRPERQIWFSFPPSNIELTGWYDLMVVLQRYHATVPAHIDQYTGHTTQLIQMHYEDSSVAWSQINVNQCAFDLAYLGYGVVRRQLANYTPSFIRTGNSDDAACTALIDPHNSLQTSLKEMKLTECNL